MIRVGLIGCGEHAEAGHAVPLARYKADRPDDLELTAVCDFRRERAEDFCKRFGFLKPFTELDEFLNTQQLDLCIAVVPVEAIASVGIRLAKHGAPCVIEKPLGSSLSEITALRDAFRSTGTPNMVSVNRRFMPLLNRAIEWTRSAGDLRYLRATMSRHARTEPEFLWGTAVHAVDALRYIAGEIKKDEVRSLRRERQTVTWYGIDLEFENGISGRIDVLPTAGVLEETYELSGDGFRAVVTSPFGPERGLRCYRENRLVLHQTDRDMTEDVVFGFYEESAAVIQNLLHVQPLKPGIEDVYPSVELCLKMAAQIESTLHNS
jgi:predicted dehydrogenase